MDIPAKVREAAQWLVDRYSGEIVYLGEYEGAAAYMFQFQEDVDTGFPFVYLLNGDKLTEINGPESLDIAGSFVEDTGEL